MAATNPGCVNINSDLGEGFGRFGKEPCQPIYQLSSQPSTNWRSTSGPQKAIGVTLPPAQIARAHEVIE
jgi:hypothetical protein